MAEPRKAKEGVQALEVLRNEFEMAGWPACYECEFEPKTIGLSRVTRMIACMTKTWFHRPPKKKVAIRGLARLR